MSSPTAPAQPRSTGWMLPTLWALGLVFVAATTGTYGVLLGPLLINLDAAATMIIGWGRFGSPSGLPRSSVPRRSRFW